MKQSWWPRDETHCRLHTCLARPCSRVVHRPVLSGAWMCCRAYDWKSGNRFQQYTSPIQPGSLESESGIFALTFDKCAGNAMLNCSLLSCRWLGYWSSSAQCAQTCHPRVQQADWCFLAAVCCRLAAGWWQQWAGCRVSCRVMADELQHKQASASD